MSDKISVFEHAKRFCKAHVDSYIELINSDSMDVDADFLLLWKSIWGDPVRDYGDNWAPNPAYFAEIAREEQ